jgi:uncharacterized protein (DUF924 family)
MHADWSREVLRFWFEEIEPEAWYRGDAETDRTIRDRFLDLHRWISNEPLAALTGDPGTALAAVIVLDQFSRNMFRDLAGAFASDAKALALAEAAIAAGFDRRLKPAQREFLYMPFEHSEDPAMQARSVELFTALGSPEALRYAVEHKAEIERFGRFPGRNDVLGRQSTEEEIVHLRPHPTVSSSS